MKDVEKNIIDRGIKKTWLMKHLEMSSRTFYIRLKEDNWKADEKKKLIDLKLVG